MPAYNAIISPTAGVSPGKRKRGYMIDTMVAFFAAAALTLCYVSLVTWAQQPTLLPWAFTPLPVGAILPSGWILGEMQTLARGLAGHQYDFYKFVNESRWLQAPGTGGTDYSPLNEALPYWFNGLVPLAYLLDDVRLKDQVHSAAGIVLDLQSKDGWIGPEVPSERNFWARAPFFLGLTQLAEANSTWEKPVVRSLRKFMDLTNNMLRNDSQGHAVCAPGFKCFWGQTRVHDMIISIQWLLDNHPSDQDPLLWDNMIMFYDQSRYKWDEWYRPGSFQEVVEHPTTKNPDYPFLHGVNVGQGLKASAVIRRFNRNESLVKSSMTAVEWTFKYHGAPSGSILADEIERDLAPYMGSELCTAVETGYSLAYMYHTLGTNYYADRAELVIYNAMPVMMTGDGWSHQYLDQPNGPWAVMNKQDYAHPDGPFLFTTAHRGAATTFGLEPQYPCCTVNHPQGYPKFVTHSWGLVDKRGLAHVLLSPSKVTTSLATIECNTAYPFDHTLHYTITSRRGFDLYLRVPSWHVPGTSSLKIGDASTPIFLQPDPESGMHHVRIPAGKTTITYTLGAQIRTESRANNTIAVYYGSSLYALDVGQAITSSLPHAYNDALSTGFADIPFPQARDYYITNTTAWNIAIDPSTLEYHHGGDELPSPIFEYGAPPSYMSVRGCEIEWDLYLEATPGTVPMNRTCVGGRGEYRLIPYGSAKVHMSELPVVSLKLRG